MRTRRASAPAAGLLDHLGLIGLDGIEPLVIASVAAELPMLLIGPHGTGKSLLLTRVAEAMGLRWRHYNASLLSYDDLAGYPVPDGRGGLDWLRTPATIWDAQAVFLDEINRCRPDIQNKLFPIVHERRIQGIALPDLCHRWAAMNPVSEHDQDDPYLGAEALDVALADRFAFVVPMPDWRGLPAVAQERLLLSDLRPVEESAAAALRDAVAATRGRYLDAVAHPDPRTAAYVRHALRLLDEADLRCSPRRGAQLVRIILAVQATGLLSAEDAALAALRNGLPQRASGGTIKEHRVVAAHREALLASRAGGDGPEATLLAIPDRLERTVRALELPDLDPTLRASVVADGFADLPDGARHALALHAFEHGLVGGLLGAVAAQLAEAFALVTTPQGAHASLGARSPRHEAWLEITRTLSGLPPGREAALEENLLVGLWGAGRIGQATDVARVRKAWSSSRARLGARGAAAAGEVAA